MVGEILLLKLFLSLLDDPNSGFTKKGRQSAKISTQKFIENEFFMFNYDFENIKYFENWSLEEINPFDINNDVAVHDNKKVVFNWSLENHGKRWSEEHLNKLEEMCIQGKSFLEMAYELKRRETSLMSRLNSQGWQYELTYNGELSLVNTEKHHKFNYSPKSIYNGTLVLDQSWFNKSLTLSFPLPLMFADESELDIEFGVEGNMKSIKIQPNLMSYVLTNKPINFINKSNVIIRNPVLGEVIVDFAEYSNSKWSEIYLRTLYFKKINVI